LVKSPKRIVIITLTPGPQSISSRLVNWSLEIPKN
jgi:hypothetical protein